MKTCPACEFLNYPEAYECLRCSEVFPVEVQDPNQPPPRVPFLPSTFFVEEIYDAYLSDSDQLEDLLLDALEVVDREKEKHGSTGVLSQGADSESSLEFHTALADLEALLAEALEEKDWQEPDWDCWHKEAVTAVSQLDLASSALHERLAVVPNLGLDDLVG